MVFKQIKWGLSPRQIRAHAVLVQPCLCLAYNGFRCVLDTANGLVHGCPENNIGCLRNFRFHIWSCRPRSSFGQGWTAPRCALLRKPLTSSYQCSPNSKSLCSIPIGAYISITSCLLPTTVRTISALHFVQITLIWFFLFFSPATCVLQFGQYQE